MQFPSWWRNRNLISWFFWPFSFIFGFIVAIRRQAYRWGIFKTYKSTLPIIVIGNISVGGTGKTPLVIALAEYLKQQHLRPAIISRGYKSQATEFPFLVTADTPVTLAGDEPLMMAQHTQCTVMIDPQRVRAVKALEASDEYDVIISDDGLQHYAMARDIEIIVVDGKRQFGNGFLMPAGMLREPISRINKVDIVVCNSETQTERQTLHQPLAALAKTNRYFNMFLKPAQACSLSSDEKFDLALLKHKRVHAIAGIGNPERFFNLLREYQIDVSEHPFPDHHVYTEADFAFRKDKFIPIIMTEKDAVKCKDLVYNAWFVEVSAELPDGFYELVLHQLAQLRAAKNSSL